MKMKKVVILLIIGILFLNQNIPVFAEVTSNVVQDVNMEIPITPHWENTNDVKLNHSEYFCRRKVLIMRLNLLG